jgi:hypothetical protein
LSPHVPERMNRLLSPSLDRTWYLYLVAQMYIGTRGRARSPAWLKCYTKYLYIYQVLYVVISRSNRTSSALYIEFPTPAPTHIMILTFPLSAPGPEFILLRLP